MEQERESQPRREEDYDPWGQWQEDWFGIPGDVDDFIFYYDGRSSRPGQER